MEGPNDTFVALGDSVLLSCSSDISTDVDSVDWRYRPSTQGQGQCNVIHDDDEWIGVVVGTGIVPNKHKHKFSFEVHYENVSISLKPYQNLRIYNVSYNEAGCYACIDRGGLDDAIVAGQVRTAHLVVIGN